MDIHRRVISLGARGFSRTGRLLAAVSLAVGFATACGADAPASGAARGDELIVDRFEPLIWLAPGAVVLRRARPSARR